MGCRSFRAQVGKQAPSASTPIRTFTQIGLRSNDLGASGLGEAALGDWASVRIALAVAGDIWLPCKRVQLESTVITNWPVRELRPAPRPAPLGDLTYDRQSRLFGDRGQEILA